MLCASGFRGSSRARPKGFLLVGKTCAKGFFRLVSKGCAKGVRLVQKECATGVHEVGVNITIICQRHWIYILVRFGILLQPNTIHNINQKKKGQADTH